MQVRAADVAIGGERWAMRREHVRGCTGKARAEVTFIRAALLAPTILLASRHAALMQRGEGLPELDGNAPWEAAEAHVVCPQVDRPFE